MNKQNSKFTFNRKSFALSLACVGLLSTGANAYSIYDTAGTEQSIAGNSGAMTTNFVSIGAGSGGDVGSIFTINKWDVSQSLTVTAEAISGGSLGSGGLTGINVVASGGAVSGSLIIGSGAIFNAGEGSITYSGAVGDTAALTFGVVSGAGAGVTVQNGAGVGNIILDGGKFGEVIFKTGGEHFKFDGTVGSVTSKGGIRLDSAASTTLFNIGQSGVVNGFKFDSIAIADSAGTALFAGNTTIIKNDGTINALEGATNKAAIHVSKGVNVGFGDSGFSAVISNGQTGLINGNIIIGDVTGAVTNLQVSGGNAVGSILSNAGTLKGNFTLGGDINIGTKDATASAIIVNNSGAISGSVTIGGANSTTTVSGSGTNILVKNDGSIQDVIFNGKYQGIDGTAASNTLTFVNNGANGTIGSVTFTKSAVTGDSNHQGTFTLLNNEGVVTTFTNEGRLGDTAAGQLVSIVGAGTITNFNNKGVISGLTTTQDVTKAQTITNFDNSGTLQFSGAGDYYVKLGATDATAATFKNTGGLISGGSFAVSNLSTFTNAGTIIGSSFESEASTVVDKFTNSGVFSGATVDLVVRDMIFDPRSIFSGGNLTLGGLTDLNAGNTEVNQSNFTNSGTIKGADLKVKNLNTFTNYGTIIASGAGFVKDADSDIIYTFKNSGVLDNKADFNIKITDGFVNSGNIAASGGTIQITTGRTADGSIITKNHTSFINQEGGIISGDFTIDFLGKVNQKWQDGQAANTNDAESEVVDLNAYNNGTMRGTTIQITDNINSFTNLEHGLLDSVTIKSAEADGFDNILSFTNLGDIRNTVFSGANIVNFNNDGVIAVNANAGSGSDIDIGTTFKNTGIINGSGATTAAHNLTFTLKGEGERALSNTTFLNDATRTADGSLDAGTIRNTNINVENQVKSFVNNGFMDNVNIGGTTIIDRDVIGQFSNTRDLTNVNFNALTINEFSNTGYAKINAQNVFVGKLSNANTSEGHNYENRNALLNINSGAVVVTQSVFNAGNATIELNGLTSGGGNGTVGAIVLKGGPSASTQTTFLNEGTIALNSVVGNGADVITEINDPATNAPIFKAVSNTAKGIIGVDGSVKAFTNRGLMGSVAIVGNNDAGTTGAPVIAGSDTILNFENSGTITNLELDNINFTQFNNAGMIELTEEATVEGSTAATNVTTHTAVQNVKLVDSVTSGVPTTFNNSGTIVGLDSDLIVNTSKLSFNNSGEISTKTGSLNGVLNVERGDVEFNNSGIITTAGSILTGGTNNAGKFNITNTGELRLLGDKAHVDMTNVRGVTVKKWFLADIGSSESFNVDGSGFNAFRTNKIVVDGYGTGKALTFEKGSIIIDPLKNGATISAGQPYLLDKIVVDSTGKGLETLGGEGDALYDSVAFAHKTGKEDPRLVTIETIASNDPIFVVTGADILDKDGNDIRDFQNTTTTPPTTDSGSGTTSGGDTTSGGTTTPPTATGPQAGQADGIIDSFVVNVDVSKGAGVIATQSIVNNAITRNAFVGTVVNTAVNSALSAANNRIASNSDEDFSKLEKYAQVSSDVTDQTYGSVNTDTQAYVMPYYRSTSIDLPTGDSLDGDTYGIVGGLQKNLGEAGVLGFFLGYETGSADSVLFEQDDDTFYLGANYYAVLGGTSTYDYYVKGMVRFANSTTDLTRRDIGGTGGADSITYGIEGNVGLNFYNGIHTFSPEFGLSYDKVNADEFTLNNINYEKANIDIIMAKLGVNWLARFSEFVSTNVGVGIRYNFDDSYDAKLNILGQLFTSDASLGDFYYYTTVALNFAVTPNIDFSLVYNGDFSSDTSAHSGFVKLGYWW
ncbi:hypothetical protein LS70_009600 [Helicobacter sp. MIT 11-5569]|uniref:hypothetical protein n=1 Tax=Helicobacter sp. MIT 11-5569 TaxID=1548151 RepID=UPI00051FD3F4|nr:hypothetical protein [Helicobacter sp. MIT 11-5569]TLD79763.1 hypothetical protein LS70_009600 [Helicobacter sp. MIT 11-5569]